MNFVLNKEREILKTKMMLPLLVALASELYFNPNVNAH